jgi:hypothetical protein
MTHDLTAALTRQSMLARSDDVDRMPVSIASVAHSPRGTGAAHHRRSRVGGGQPPRPIRTRPGVKVGRLTEAHQAVFECIG